MRPYYKQKARTVLESWAEDAGDRSALWAPSWCDHQSGIWTIGCQQEMEAVHAHSRTLRRGGIVAQSRVQKGAGVRGHESCERANFESSKRQGGACLGTGLLRLSKNYLKTCATMRVHRLGRHKYSRIAVFWKYKEIIITREGVPYCLKRAIHVTTANVQNRLDKLHGRLVLHKNVLLQWNTFKLCSTC